MHRTRRVEPTSRIAATVTDPQHGGAAPEAAPGFASALHAAIARLTGTWDIAMDDARSTAAGATDADGRGVGGNGAGEGDATDERGALERHLREMRELLRDELVRRSDGGGCPPHQQLRIAAGAAALDELAREVCAAGADLDCHAVAARSVEVLRDALDLAPETDRERVARGDDDGASEVEDGGLVLGALDDDVLELEARAEEEAGEPLGLPAPGQTSTVGSSTSASHAGARELPPPASIRRARFQRALDEGVTIGRRGNNAPAAVVPDALTPKAPKAATTPPRRRLALAPALPDLTDAPAVPTESSDAPDPARPPAAPPSARIIGARPTLLALPAPTRLATDIDIAAAQAERVAARADLEQLLSATSALRDGAGDRELRAFLDD